MGSAGLAVLSIRKSQSWRREVAASKAAFLHLNPKNCSCPGRRRRSPSHHIQVDLNFVIYSQKIDSIHKQNVIIGHSHIFFEEMST